MSAILLAAGRSIRMGSPKALLPLGDRLVVCRCLETLFEAGIDDVVVVLGAHGDAIRAAIRGMPVRLAWNLDGESDMARSARVGISSVAPEATGVLVALIDHPRVRGATVKALVRRHMQDQNRIFLPVFRGRTGHPTLFPRGVIEEIFAVSTLKDVVRRDDRRVGLVEVADPGVLDDMDTPEDYRRLLAGEGGGHTTAETA